MKYSEFISILEPVNVTEYWNIYKDGVKLHKWDYELIKDLDVTKIELDAYTFDSPYTETCITVNVYLEEKIMNYINLTPHSINLIGVGELPSSGIARVKDTLTGDGILKIRTYGAIEGLPEAKDNTVYIVSSMVMSQAVKNGRTDVYAPSDFVRDEDGKIVGCKSLCRDKVR